jgi:hypothetical protein
MMKMEKMDLMTLVEKAACSWAESGTKCSIQVNQKIHPSWKECVTLSKLNSTSEVIDNEDECDSISERNELPLKMVQLNTTADWANFFYHYEILRNGGYEYITQSNNVSKKALDLRRSKIYTASHKAAVRIIKRLSDRTVYYPVFHILGRSMLNRWTAINMLAHWQNYDETNLCQMGMLKDLEILSYLRYLTQTNLGTKMEGYFQVSFIIWVLFVLQSILTFSSLKANQPTHE